MNMARIIRIALPAILLVVSAPCLHGALPVNSYEARRDQAYKLTDDRSPEAEPALLALLKEKPDDGGVLFGLGRVTLNKAHLLDPGPARWAANQQALDYFGRARAAGFQDPLIDHAFNVIDSNGREKTAMMSSREQIDKLLKEGERFFERHEFAKAAEKYVEA